MQTDLQDRDLKLEVGMTTADILLLAACVIREHGGAIPLEVLHDLTADQIENLAVAIALLRRSDYAAQAGRVQ